MRIIYKYELPLRGKEAIPMPRDARLLSVGVQGGGVVLWAEVDPREPEVRRELESRFTGQRIERKGGEPYVGTVTLVPGDPLVVHVFDLGEL